MNDKHTSTQGEDSNDGEVIEKHAEHALLHVATKLAPIGLAALFSFVGSTAVNFFSDLNSRVERLDHNCPITEQRVKVLEDSVYELRKTFAEYPRDYEIKRAITLLETLTEYAGTDRVVVERLVRDVDWMQKEIRTLIREHNAAHKTQKQD